MTGRYFDKELDRYRYFDKNGDEIHEGDFIKLTPMSKPEKVYACVGDFGKRSLGTDATNPAWIKSGRAAPCEFGVYPFEHYDLEECEIVNPADCVDIPAHG